MREKGAAPAGGPGKRILKPRKNRRKKLSLKDRVRAAAIAGIFVALTFLCWGTVFLLYSRGKAAPEVPASRAPENPAVTAKPGVPAAPEAPKPAAPEAAGPGPAAPKAAASAVPKNPAAPANSGVPAGPEAVRPGASAREPARPSAVPVPEPPPGPAGRLVFVIDDAGNNLGELDPFLNFPGPLTIAVLPGLPHSREAARRIRAAGKEVFLHQPMEPLGGQNPGPGAVFAGMEAAEIRRVVGKNLDEIGPVAGMNNHEGSRVTMDEAAMETLLSLCGERGIIFLDSRTTAETAAPAAALKLGMRIGERNVFLDNEQDRESMLRSIRAGMERAERRGAAVMIGHTWSPALAPLLGELYPDLLSRGYRLETMSQFMESGR